MYDIIFIGKKNEEWDKLKKRFITAKYAETFDKAKSIAFTKMFWAVWDDVQILDDFDFTYCADNYSLGVAHVFKNKDFFDGVCLFPKEINLHQREVTYRFFAEKKEVDLQASVPKPYDKFIIESWEDYCNALENSSTEMFWAVSNNLTYDTDFLNNLYFSHHNSYDRQENHAFIHHVNNKDLYNGVFLLSKNKPISKKEIEYRFLVNAKQWDHVASGSVTYDIFGIDTYEDYCNALENSSTEMFWVVPSDVIVKDEFEFDWYYSHDQEYERNTNHVFLNDQFYDGIMLCSKYATISEREYSHRFLVNKKEHEVVASKPKPYDKFIIESWEDYCNALENSSTEMFWAVSNNLTYDTEFLDKLYFSHHNSYDRQENHAFVHRFNEEDLYNGVFLLSKNKPISKKEIEYRFLVDAKQHKEVVSGSVQYEIFTCNKYSDYQNALETSKTEMFYITSNKISINKDFKFDFYFPHNEEYDRKINHVFLNGKYHDGIVLCSKHAEFSSKEFEHMFIANKKEHNIVASSPKPYDIVFISYNEPNADNNFEKLKEQFPDRVIHRVHGVKGIHQAHIMAAKTAETEMFWVVDGDATIVDEFKFDYQVPCWHKDNVFVWRSINPINDLVYGYGGIKLFPRKNTIDMNVNTPDMTTSISSKFNAIPQISNITGFNTDPFNTWKSAFRECAKLASKSIDRQKTGETDERLKTWTTVGHDRRFGKYALDGARAGMRFGLSNKSDISLINDFDWLEEKFNEQYS